ncbi:nucleoside-diphosphate-sugar epimerase [Fonsecaea monophora]|uniref:Nucleoside-diphosphate-sugar epimerase n=1 Tax=Fonsecaea monophora TaxID=254056 RepID=A0A177FEC9_9EURO|nr:nucleoside-diphosphate-sugar epimerase [Fonsecaea monophora]OAG41559.1 nucleoside-diphosphate-sugar epimerase [Fonsecaea monophora]
MNIICANKLDSKIVHLPTLQTSFFQFRARPLVRTMTKAPVQNTKKHMPKGVKALLQRRVVDLSAAYDHKIKEIRRGSGSAVIVPACFTGPGHCFPSRDQDFAMSAYYYPCRGSLVLPQIQAQVDHIITNATTLI